MNYPVYPNYKPSGVEWLGDVPQHWEMKPLKRCVNFIEGPGILAMDFSDEGVPLIRIAGIGGRIASLEGCNFLAPDLVGSRWSHFRVQLEDLLISGSASTGFCSEVGEETAGAIPYTGIIITRPKPGLADKTFIRWFFLSDQFLSQAELSKTGSTIQHFGPTHLFRMSIALPPLAEQRAIANFLDAETAKVDTLTAKKRELIEKLKEKRIALISRAVTRGLPPEIAEAVGLDPNPKLEPSGIQWLGEIPEHWEVSRLGYLVSKVGSGKTPRGGAEVYQSEGVMLIRSQNVHDDGLRLTDVVFIDKCIDEEMSETRVFPKDVLLNITGASLGRCAVVPDSFGEANVNQHVCILRPEPSKAEARFIQRVISSEAVQSQIFSFENGSSREGLNFQQVRSLLVALPAVREQRVIADYLDRETAKIDRMVKKVEEAIERLQEYRTALVTAAVTGKIDVRNVRHSGENPEIALEPGGQVAPV